MLRRFHVLLCLFIFASILGVSHAQEPALVSPNVFLRGLELANGVRYTASFVKPTDDTVMRNLSVEITLPVDAQFTEMLVSRQVQFDVIRRNQQGQLTLIWQISRVDAESPLDVFAFTLEAPLNAEIEFYMEWQDEEGQTFVENFFELPATILANETESSISPDTTDFTLAGNTGIHVATNTANPLQFRVLANDFNPPVEYGSIWWCSLVELRGLTDGDSAMVLVPLRRPVAPFTELFLFQQKEDGTWLALNETGIVTADGQFVMYRHLGGLIATGGDEQIQQAIVPLEDAVIEVVPPADGETPWTDDRNGAPPSDQPLIVPTSQPNTAIPTTVAGVPTQGSSITDGSSNTVIIGEATVTPIPTRNSNIADGSSNTISIGEATVTPPNPSPTRRSNITDGSSNTIIIGEASLTPSRTSTQSSNIADGSSNTIIIGEATVTPPNPSPTRRSNITDGSSNTIIIGEPSLTPSRTPTALSNIADGSSNTIIIGEPSLTPSRTSTQSSNIADGSSNTIIIGEATVTPSRTPTALSNIADGSSNTIFIGEPSVTPSPTLPDDNAPTIEDESSQAVIPSATSPAVEVPPVIITIPPPFGAGGVRVLIVQRDDGGPLQCQIGGVLCAPLLRRAGNR